MARATVVQVVFGNVKLDKPNGGHSHTYSYDTGNLDLQVGDRVVVPINWAHGREQLATVVALGRGDYDGPLQTLAGKVQPVVEPMFNVGKVILTKSVTEAFLSLAAALEGEDAALLRIEVGPYWMRPAPKDVEDILFGIPVYVPKEAQ